jgi:hypothetical protein
MRQLSGNQPKKPTSSPCPISENSASLPLRREQSGAIVAILSWSEAVRYLIDKERQFMGFLPYLQVTEFLNLHGSLDHATHQSPVTNHQSLFTDH